MIHTHDLLWTRWFLPQTQWAPAGCGTDTEADPAAGWYTGKLGMEHSSSDWFWSCWKTQEVKQMLRMLLNIKWSNFSFYIWCIFTRQTKASGLESLQLLQIVMLLDELQVEDGSNLHRKNAQQLLLVGDVRYYRLCAVKQAQEDVASMSSVAVNLLCCLLGQAAHHTLHSVHRRVGN